MLASPGELPAPKQEHRWAFEMKWDGIRAVVYLGRWRPAPDDPQRPGGLGHLSRAARADRGAGRPPGRPGRRGGGLRRGRPAQLRRAAGPDARPCAGPGAARPGAGQLPGLRRAAPGRRFPAGPHLRRAPCGPGGAGAGGGPVGGPAGLRRAGRGRPGGLPGAGAGRCPRQAARLDVPGRPALTALGEGQAPAHAGGRGRRLVARGRPARGRHRLAAARRARRGGTAGLRRTRGHRVHRLGCSTDLGRRLRAAERRTAPFADEVPRAHAKDAHWVTPQLVGEVRFSEWTRDGRMRHPAWRGLRPDKAPEDVRRES